MERAVLNRVGILGGFLSWTGSGVQTLNGTPTPKHGSSTPPPPPGNSHRKHSYSLTGVIHMNLHTCELSYWPKLKMNAYLSMASSLTFYLLSCCRHAIPFQITDLSSMRDVYVTQWNELAHGSSFSAAQLGWTSDQSAVVHRSFDSKSLHATK